MLESLKTTDELEVECIEYLATFLSGENYIKSCEFFNDYLIAIYYRGESVLYSPCKYKGLIVCTHIVQIRQ